MLSKNKIKFINSLSLKKNRDEEGLFVAEGEKIIKELIAAHFEISTIICTEKYSEYYNSNNYELIIADESEIKKVSSLKTSPQIMAICRIKKSQLDVKKLKSELSIALDDIQDPGNLGTIIRLASWFGIKNIICSSHTVDCYNPKVIQATMGSIAHVDIYYLDLPEFLSKIKTEGLPVYGTFLEGKNIYSTELNPNGIVVFGNEGNGISEEVENQTSHKLYIPPYKQDILNVESLNVSIAASIICAEFRRRSSE
jgi:RNA methyltransferase, TrmH family